MLDRIKKVYDSLPFDKMSALKYVPDSLLFGRGYSGFLTSFDSSMIKNNLFKLLNYARDNTVYWSKKIPEKIAIEDTFAVYMSLPTVSSDDLSENIDLYVSKEYNKRNSYFSTTGGTGRNPTPILLSDESFGIEWAHIHRIWAEIGYARRKHLKLTIAGKRLKGNSIIKYNPIYNELIVDFYKINLNNFWQFYKKLQTYKIEFIEAYPSLIKELRHYLEMSNTTLRLKGIMLGSEGIELAEKKDLMIFFRCPVVTWYGQSEKIILAQNTRNDDLFKVFTSYGYPDILSSSNGFGEILGTTFVNKALPLIKYRTGDFGEVIRNGKQIFIRNIKGRWGKDLIYLDENKSIPTTSINIHSEIQKEILFYQISQNEFGKIHITVLPKKTSSKTNAEIELEIQKEISEKLCDFSVTCSTTENENDIIRSKRGKMIMLVQNINKTQSC